MWKLLTAIGIGIIVFLILWAFLKNKKPSRSADVQETYICPSCGSRNCDCYKHKA